MKTEKELQERYNELLQLVRTQIEIAVFQSPNGIPQGPAYQETIIRVNELEYVLGVEKKA